MEDDDVEEVQVENYDDNIHQACYIFNPAEESGSTPGRPSKKRKLNGLSPTPKPSFPLLLNGKEPEDHARLRSELFRDLWSAKQAKIDEALGHVNRELVTDFANFVNDSGAASTDNEKLPVAIMVSGSDSNAQRRLLHAWHEQPHSVQSPVLVQLQPSHCSNLQTCLKNIIKSAIVEIEGLGGYNDHLNKHKRLIPMNFDLELLQEFIKDRNVSKIVVSILDAETFDVTMLMEIVSHLHSWLDRIPFVLVLGLATTVELLEGRLANFIMKLLDARVFELSLSSDDPFNQVFKICQTDEESVLFMGPTTIATLCEMTYNQGATVEGFTRAIKYVYMSHFFSNSLSVLLNRDRDLSKAGDAMRSLCQAIRNTDSFHGYCEDLLQTSNDKKTRSKVQSLLKDDTALLQRASSSLAAGQRAYRRIALNISALTDLYHAVKPTLASTESRFATSAQIYQSLPDVNCDLLQSSIYHDEISPVLRTMRSEQLLRLLESLDPMTLSTLNLETSLSELRTFQKSFAPPDHLVRSEHDLSFFPSNNNNNTSVATIVATQKATATSSSPPNKSKQRNKADHQQKDNERRYASLLDMLLETLEMALSSPRINIISAPSAALLSEAYIFNLRQPLLNALIYPRPRYSIERALSRPNDYLGCGHASCTGDANGNTDVTTAGNEEPAPPSSVLYTLLQEAPVIINVRDLFDAFCSRLGPVSVAIASNTDINPDNGNGNAEHEDKEAEEVEREEEAKSERMRMVLFYRALADLKLLGLVKASASVTVKRKAVLNTTGGKSASGAAGAAGDPGDVAFIAKTSWLGL